MPADAHRATPALKLATAEVGDEPTSEPEAEMEKPNRLHDLRLGTVAQVLKDNGVSSVLDLGCGERKLMQRPIKERGFQRILGVDPSVRTLEKVKRWLWVWALGRMASIRCQGYAWGENSMEFSPHILSRAIPAPATGKFEC